jgi:hypothetical protein
MKDIREQIIEILQKIGANVYIPYDVKCDIADAILAIEHCEESAEKYMAMRDNPEQFKAK